jgi:hypothetical protein
VRGDLDLARETVRANRRHELGAQNLDRHGAAVAAIVGEIDGRHAAARDLSLDDVPIRQHSAHPASGLTGLNGIPDASNRRIFASGAPRR